MKDLEDFDGRFMNNGINGLLDDKFQDQKMLLIRKFFIEAIAKAHQAGKEEAFKEVKKNVKERIGMSESLIEEYEKGNDLNGGDIQESFDHETSVKVAMENLLADLINKKNKCLNLIK